jgi:hypothetical protein
MFCRQNNRRGKDGFELSCPICGQGCWYPLPPQRTTPPKKHSLRTCNALDINKSAASAVLQPLQTSGVIVYDEQSKRCSLDLSFIELASAVSSQLTHVTLLNLF